MKHKSTMLLLTTVICLMNYGNICFDSKIYDPWHKDTMNAHKCVNLIH